MQRLVPREKLRFLETKEELIMGIQAHQSRSFYKHNGNAEKIEITGVKVTRMNPLDYDVEFVRRDGTTGSMAKSYLDKFYTRVPA